MRKQGNVYAKCNESRGLYVLFIWTTQGNKIAIKIQFTSFHSKQYVSKITTHHRFHGLLFYFQSKILFMLIFRLIVLRQNKKTHKYFQVFILWTHGFQNIYGSLFCVFPFIDMNFINATKCVKIQLFNTIAL